MVVGIVVRKFLIVLLSFLAVTAAHAWEPTTADVPSEDALAQASYAEALVTIAPIPMPATVIELASYSSKSKGVGQTKKLKAAKVARAKSMLSRSAREQIALSSQAGKPDDRAHLTASDDEDADTGIDELDFHRSFSQPKVARSPDQADDDEEAGSDLSDHVKLRLLVARTKAVEAHILTHVAKATAAPDEEALSDTVKIRLAIARARAVKAHSEKFGEA